MAIDLSTRGIDPSDQQFGQMLDQMQGNILKGHGRDHTVHIFMKFHQLSQADHNKLVKLVNSLVTSALKQHRESVEFKRFSIPGSLFANFFLTAQGYRALGFSSQQIDNSFKEAPDPLGTTKSNFREGMIAHGDELNDPAPNNWEAGYQGGDIHAMLLLADDDEGFLLRRSRDVASELETFATILAVEHGRALRNAQGEGIEHFGYVDGRSQPIYYLSDLPSEGATDKWNPIEPLNRVLVPDALAQHADSFGSYFVFRKLEQDVLHFKIREAELADALGLEEDDRERAGAMAVGRFEDGTPVVLSQTDGFIPRKENNFTYASDPDALKCPFHAHIRKTNPRGDIVRKLVPGGDEEDVERPRRITRRGITYGVRNIHPNALQGLDDLPLGGVGLLFMCFQASITKQFAFIQRSWANSSDFLLAGTGPDPVIAQAGAVAGALQKWPEDWGPQPDPANPGQTVPPQEAPFSFGNFVTLKGGEFFFAPSIPFLKRLKP